MAFYDVTITITNETRHTYRVEAEDVDHALDQADHELMDLDNEGQVHEEQVDIQRSWIKVP